MLCVRKAEISEIPAVMQFIAEHWKKDHILAVDRDFFEWMYVQGDELNFNLAVDDETGKFLASMALFYIITKQIRICPALCGRFFQIKVRHWDLVWESIHGSDGSQETCFRLG